MNQTLIEARLRGLVRGFEVGGHVAVLKVAWERTSDEAGVATACRACLLDMRRGDYSSWYHAAVLIDRSEPSQ